MLPQPHHAAFRPVTSGFARDVLPWVSISTAPAAVAYRLDERLEKSSRARARGSPVASCCAPAALFAGACASHVRSRNARHSTLQRKAQQRDESSTGAPWLEVAGAVASALLDIFKAPPEEATGADAPGLKEMTVAPTTSLEKCEVVDVFSGKHSPASHLLQPRVSGKKTAVFFLTHWGDFNSWEVTQKVRSAIKAGRINASTISLVGIGSAESGRRFVDMLDLPADVQIYADREGSCYSCLNFSRGALPQYADSLSPYFRVFLMLLGVGSPGTIRTVLGGYIGDRSLPNTATSWIDESLRQGAEKGRWPVAVPDMMGDWKMLNLAEVGSGVWDEGFGKDGQRPFELATIRLQNMVGGIIANWSDLAPENDELLVQQGGALVISPEGEIVYYYRDKGILTYVPMDDAVEALQS